MLISVLTILGYIVGISAQQPEVITAQTGPFPVYQMREIPITDGFAKASSEYSSARLAKYGFIDRSSGNGWMVASYGRTLPVMIWYDFSSRSYRPKQISFQPGDSGSSLRRTPTEFEFVGSNDKTCDEKTSSWTVLCQNLKHTHWSDFYEARYCTVDPEKIKEKFRCLGLRVLKSRMTGSDGYTSLRNIRMWEVVEN